MTLYQKVKKYIKEMGVEYYEELPVIGSSSNVRLKDLDSICKRVVVCLSAVILANDVMSNEDYNLSRATSYVILKNLMLREVYLNPRRKCSSTTLMCER